VTNDPSKSSRKYFDIVETLKRVNKLKRIFRDKVDLDLSKEDFREMIRQVLTVMPQDLPSHKIQDSIAHLFGRPLTTKIANETAWRLSGNTEILRDGEVVTNNIAITKEGWCAVQVLACRPFLNNPRSRSHRVRGCKYTCLVITGHAAGCVVEKFLTLRHIRYLAGELGFSAPFKNRPFKDERELFGMRFGALFIPSLVVEGKPGFSETCVAPSMLSWNKQIIKNRFRDGYECPLNESVEKLACFRCWKGANSCVAAVHGKDFEQDFCEFCNQDSLFDPESVGYALGICVNCQRHEDTTGLAVKRRVDSVE
jgi:hypothetical protein